MKRIIHHPQKADEKKYITAEVQNAADGKSNDLFNLAIKSYNLLRHDTSQTAKSFAAFYMLAPLPNGTLLLCEETISGEQVRHDDRLRVIELFENITIAQGKSPRTLTVTF